MNTSPKQIAAAVQAQVKCLRILGREDTCLFEIARALMLTEDEVTAAFNDYRISGATINKNIKQGVIRTTVEYSPKVALKAFNGKRS